ncbi:unnamed protein product [Enterobius vermicularis]|uniref:PID domain-containing protein n=1 Tax=Enterobius vermicularis TaxID=51028 RepID=A0A0N4UYG9_ENTVE|nr:unnamed protein product [Enterobius vermicularis]
MPKVITCVLFRPTSSGTLVTLSDFTLDEEESKTVALPSVSDIRQMITERGRLHFDNKDSIKLDQHICHFSVITGAPCPLIYACVCEPSFSPEQASIFLDALQGPVVNDASLLPRLSSAGDYQLQQDIGPKFAYLMVSLTKLFFPFIESLY